MLKTLYTLLAALALFTVPVAAQAQSTSDVDKLCNDALGLLKAGKAAEMVDATLGKSPLIAGKEAEIQAITTQFDTALQIYGPVQGWELVDEDWLGTSVVRRHYIVRQTKMVTRWEFQIARLEAGLMVLYLGFEDQVRTWHN